ncbi:putative Na(+)/H(+) antiporter subunit C1 [Rhodovastum atsumiense]|uniref:Na+/H+ antiporter subunit C n=1 Tax=Rhodovastum atsumiense TaxID=504468 RepID=A0A5M6IJA4_9PROT|nr:NADH-quinone oxidoreductase subunit K [Rhodovastum atsumiense]KAA5608343.1 hypothetical protein F1189_29500 [Rhodovastum atsumiense]CAH2602343.1 putative Na(+)/H(+) antiporter subunit C1 [Rhodovastum atsumiense]
MSAVPVFGLCGAALVGLGLFALVTTPHLLRKIVAFNLIGAGVFLIFGSIARRGAADAVPQALVITGVVVAFAATALAVMLVLRLFQETGAVTLAEAAPDHDEDAA